MIRVKDSYATKSESTGRKDSLHIFLFVHYCFRGLRQAKTTEEGSFYNCLTAELFSAFSLEAYLNHLGVQKLPYWESVERKLGPNGKLKIICHELDLKPNFGTRPFQSFRILFQLRNSFVHGKTEYLEMNDEQSLKVREKPKMPKTKWQSLINLDMAIQFTEDTQKMIKTLHAKSGMQRNPLFSPETSQWLIRPSKINQEK